METQCLKLWLEAQGGSAGEDLGKGKQVCYRCFKRTGSRPAEAAASLHPRVLREARANQSGDDPDDDQHGLTRPLPLMTRQQGRAFYSEKLLPNTTRMTACPGAPACWPQAAWLLERLLHTPPSRSSQQGSRVTLQAQESLPHGRQWGVPGKLGQSWSRGRRSENVSLDAVLVSP